MDLLQTHQSAEGGNGAVQRGTDAQPARCAAPALWSFVLGLTSGDRDRAQDVVQETLLRAWRHPELLQVNGTHADASIRSWLFTVARG
jgi:DNA-directed RNA polymerase specialized sigma24 family protein